MFFDRYEIHIQAFVDFINAIAIIPKSSSSQNIIQQFHIFEISKLQDFNISKFQDFKILSIFSVSED